jgi:hypothetical protein
MGYLPWLVIVVGFMISAWVDEVILQSDRQGLGQYSSQPAMFVLVLFASIAICGWLARLVAKNTRRNLAMLLGFMLGPVGVIIAAILPDE